jgi:hypothetical protein
LSSVDVPENASFIGGDAFPAKCVINYGRSRRRY